MKPFLFLMILGLLVFISQPQSILAQSGEDAAVPLEYGGALPGLQRRDSTRNDMVFFDSISGTDTNFAHTIGTPRTFMGLAANFAGDTAIVTELETFLGSIVGGSYSSIQLQVQFWEDFDSSSDAVFSNPIGGVYTFDLGGRNLAPNTYYGVGVPFDPPVVFADTLNNGITLNWQGDTGAGLESSESLTSILRGNSPIAVGANVLRTGFYRNNSGRTDFNFDNEDLRNLPVYTDVALALRLYNQLPAVETATPAATSSSTSAPTVTQTLTSTYTPSASLTLEASPTATTTPTVTLTPSSTYTPSLEPTPTAMLTPVDLLSNGGFEMAQLLPWTLKNPSRDKVKCNKPDKQVSNNGECAFMFKGSAGENSKIQQNAVLSGLDFAIGDRLDLSAYLNATHAESAGKIKLRVKYSDTTPTGKITLELVPITGYVEWVDDYLLQSAALDKIKVQFQHTGTAGKLYVDDVRLMYTAGAARRETIPLP